MKASLAENFVNSGLLSKEISAFLFRELICNMVARESFPTLTSDEKEKIGKRKKMKRIHDCFIGSLFQWKNNVTKAKLSKQVESTSIQTNVVNNSTNSG